MDLQNTAMNAAPAMARALQKVRELHKQERHCWHDDCDGFVCRECGPGTSGGCPTVRAIDAELGALAGGAE